MNITITRLLRSALLLALLSLTACGGGGAAATPPPTAVLTYTVGGTLSGLIGSVVLQNNLGDNLTVSANGNFAFATQLSDSTAYSVSILTQPSGQICSPSSNTGTVTGGNVNSVTVTCASSSTTYSVGGTVSGATPAGVTISLTGTASATTTTDAGGVYSFASLANGSYTVTPSKLGYIFSPTSSAVSVSGANVSGTNFMATGQSQATGQINDTGITSSQCYQAGSDTLVACSSAGALTLNNAQDGMVGRDANPATNSNADGKLGFSYTTVTGGCVQDNVTGLMWEVKTASNSATTYTNYDSTTSAQKWNGAAYVNPTQADIDAATNTVGFVAAVNASNLCAHNDWRLPSADELQSILDYGVAFPGPDPAIDATWFPNTQGNIFWSSSPNVSDSGNAWYVDFRDGNVNPGSSRSSSFNVRLVRSSQYTASAKSFVISADGNEVTDQKTGLIWKRCSEGMNWNGITCAGSFTPYTHEAALKQASTQATNTGVAWRLPNVKELTSIADKSLSNPAIDSTAFPATPADWFWSSSPYAGGGAWAWYVYISYGHVGASNRSNNCAVRLVRAGQ